MSFLGDLVNSIGTNKAPALPKPPSQPASRPPISSSAAHSNPVPQPKVTSGTATPPVAGLKRKLDERDAKPSQPSERSVKPNPASGLTSKIIPKPISQPPNGVKPPLSKPLNNPISTQKSSINIPLSKISTSTSTTSSPAAAKPPVKGSYAEMMARAKEAQQSRAQNPLGTIKHQATSKEKISKLAERRRQEQEKLKAGKERKSEKSAPAAKPDRKRGSSPIKKSDQVKVPRAPRPPLHAPASSYKGTMGKSSKKPRDERVQRNSRYDEYLATDEEDNSELDDYGDEDGYGSEGSSDMEAGLDDIDMEESAALKAAREDDARELAYESQLKREKEERKRRLQAMAKKSR